MAKKNKKNEKDSSIENYYDLKIDKIDELVEALKSEGNTSSEEEISMDIAECTGSEEDTTTKLGKRKKFDPYKADKLSRIPTWVKALFIKFWFAGLVCFFILFGIKFADILDTVIITGVVFGIIVDLMVNPIFGYLESDKKEYNPYIMFPFPFKAYWTFFTNIIYYLGVMLCVYFSYSGLNWLINVIKSTKDIVYIGVEPLLFGALSLVIDMAFIGIKDLIVFLVNRAKRKKEDRQDV